MVSLFQGWKSITSLLLAFLALIAIIGCTCAEEKPIVVATTSVIGSVIEDLAGDKVDLYIVVSPAVCPAHYDLKPSDVYIFSKASLIFYHGFELWIEDLYEASGSKAKLVKISGSWNTPDGIKSYYRNVALKLEEELGIDVSNRLNEILPKIDSIANEIKSNAEKAGVSKVKVIAMKWIEEFVKWLGFKVIADFGPPEKLSSADVERLIEMGKEQRAALVISNLQSGVDFGESLANDIGAEHIILTNFPWTDPDLKTLIDVLMRNSEELIKGAKLYQIRLMTIRLERELEFYKILSYCLIAVAVIEAIFLAYMVRRVRR
ncbi:MAG: hypothetical protein DRN49_01585 [Thaumarchaeota archaeon]|nr:MAG: hypothetical protein DRN49_01585 [Nitrososphaerota archaeon]